MAHVAIQRESCVDVIGRIRIQPQIGIEAPHIQGFARVQSELRTDFILSAGDEGIAVENSTVRQDAPRFLAS